MKVYATYCNLIYNTIKINNNTIFDSFEILFLIKLIHDVKSLNNVLVNIN